LILKVLELDDQEIFDRYGFQADLTKTGVRKTVKSAHSKMKKPEFWNVSNTDLPKRLCVE
jgi:hypothetical protein